MSSNRFLLNLGHAPSNAFSLSSSSAARNLSLHAIATAAAANLMSLTFGKWTTVCGLPDSNPAGEEKPLTLKVRPLLVDGRVKEFTVGPAHDVTDRLFVCVLRLPVT